MSSSSSNLKTLPLSQIRPVHTDRFEEDLESYNKHFLKITSDFLKRTYGRQNRADTTKMKSFSDRALQIKLGNLNSSSSPYSKLRKKAPKTMNKKLSKTLYSDLECHPRAPKSELKRCMNPIFSIFVIIREFLKTNPKFDKDLFEMLTSIPVDFEDFAKRNSVKFCMMIENLFKSVFARQSYIKSLKTKKVVLESFHDPDDYLFLIQDLQGRMNLVRKVRNIVPGASNLELRGLQNCSFKIVFGGVGRYVLEFSAFYDDN